MEYTRNKKKLPHAWTYVQELPEPTIFIALTQEQLDTLRLLQDELIRLRANSLDVYSGDLNELKQSIGFLGFNQILGIELDNI